MSKHRTRATIWNRLLSGALCLALVLGLLPAAGMIQTAEAASWADPYGEQLVEWGIMKSGSDLRLGSTITRAEFVAMCNRAFGYDKLGSTPFVDVPYSAWYAQDINIAYTARYFQGTSTNTAAPLGTLTREQAAVLLARNLMLQEAVGEDLSFTDSHSLSDWSRGLVAAAAKEGMISGLPGGSFGPFNNITRGEVAAMLVRAIGNPVNKEGSYEMGDVYGNVTISSSNVTLRNTAILGNLYITGGVDLGNVLLENVTVLGRIVIAGGGESHAGQSSVVLRNVTADEMVIDSIIDQFTTVSAYGITDIPVTCVRSDTYLEDSSWTGYGLQYIELNGDPGTKLQLAGAIKEVVNKTPFSDLQLVQGTAQKITIDEYAKNSTLLIDINTRVEELNLDVAAHVTGKGDITSMTVGASDCEVDILPDKVAIRPGIVATVDGDVIGSTEASELSSEPRLLAGYPKVANLKPNEAQGQFSGNKAGTIYWAVSELADGSVTMEDLVDNPAYGGIIFQNNAGSISSGSRNVYVEQIKNLEPDGSYYLTAMLEDGRGNRSPLKVIAFTTPDDTKPEFLNGRISRETCDVVQLTGMANKSCTLYWVLLADGSAAPTANNFKSGAFGGNYGSGSLNVTKNVPVSINVNANTLQEDTNYVLYVWLNDFDGAQSSQVYKFDVHTPDETPPVVTNIMQTDFGETDAQVTFTVNEAPSTLYWAVVTEANADTFITPDTDLNSLRAQIKVESGKNAGAIVSGGTAVTTANTDTLILKSVLKGLDYKTYGTHSFIMFFVAKDAAGNYSVVGKINIHTLDTDPPHAWLEFSDSTNGTPRAGSDIKIVFDEQVKGGANAAQTFLKLYEEALDSGNKSKLASELAAHIQLWYVPKSSGTASRVTATGPTPGFESSGGGDWIDFSKAIVTMEKGKMYITLPGAPHDGDDGTHIEQAINLRSGASYQFRLIGVFDDAITPNGVAVYRDKDTDCIPPEADKDGRGKTSDNGNGYLYFTTLYAQVELFENGMTSISGGTYDKYRLDVCVDVHPLSTSNIPDTEYWDLIMWCDTEVEFEIYRRAVDEKGNQVGTGWELVSKTIPYDPGSDNGASFSAYKAESQVPKIQKVTDGLKQGWTYTYGIHFTSVNGLKEGTGENAHKTDPEDWGGSITMKFSVIAGEQRPIEAVSTATRSYDDYVNVRKTVTEIGLTYDATGGTATILTCTPREFVDTQPPSFDDGFPYFNTSSAKITMVVDTKLGRTGKMYYVVAPAPDPGGSSTLTSVSTSVNGEAIHSGNDQATAGNAMTFIPTGATQRNNDTYKDHIQFMTGDKTGEAPGPGKYDSPKASDITNSRKYDQVSNIIKAGSIELNGLITSIDIEGLRPSTKYYIYVVFQGAGRASEIVEIYQATTKKVERPVVTIAQSGSIVTMTPDQDCELAFALVEKNRTLEDWIKEKDKASASHSDLTVLEQMVKRQDQTNGPSVFDDNTNTQLKLNVATYITGGGNTGGTSDFINWVLPRSLDGQTYNGVKYDKSVPVSGGASITWDFNQYMSEGSDYVVLVAARHFYGGTGGNDYGFGAVDNLHKRDTEPPRFKPLATNKDGFLDATITSFPNNDTWTTNPQSYTYSGSVVVRFTKEIYYFDTTNRTRYNVVFAKEGSPGNLSTDGNVYILDVVGGSAVENKHVRVNETSGTVGDTITLTLANIRVGETIEFFKKGWICNASDAYTEEKLTLTFDPTLTAQDLFKTGKAGVLWGGFYVTWGK